MSDRNEVRSNKYSGQGQESKDDLLLEAEFALELITASCKNAEARCIELEIELEKSRGVELRLRESQDQLDSSRQELNEVRKQLLQCREQMMKVIEVETNERKLVLLIYSRKLDYPSSHFTCCLKLW